MLSALTIDPPEKINMAQKNLRTDQRTEVRVKWGGEGQSLDPSPSVRPSVNWSSSSGPENKAVGGGG